LQFGAADQLAASLGSAEDAGRQQRIYSISPVTVKRRYQNETIPLHTTGTETVIWAEAVAPLAGAYPSGVNVTVSSFRPALVAAATLVIARSVSSSEGKARTDRSAMPGNQAVLPTGEEAR